MIEILILVVLAIFTFGAFVFFDTATKCMKDTNERIKIADKKLENIERYSKEVASCVSSTNSGSRRLR
tara:strand:+ start:181 stop:384 length:204 start_codon:yes stop_codon:yes gene_type:complete